MRAHRNLGCAHPKICGAQPNNSARRPRIWPRSRHNNQNIVRSQRSACVLINFRHTALKIKNTHKFISINSKMPNQSQRRRIDPQSAVVAITEGAISVLNRTPFSYQIKAWNAIFRAEDVIVIAGTGSGKSLIFQALHFAKSGGFTLVISPLKSLMADQVFDPYCVDCFRFC